MSAKQTLLAFAVLTVHGVAGQTLNRAGPLEIKDFALKEKNILQAEKKPLSNSMVGGYDCDPSFSKISTIDLTEPAKCPDPQSDYEPPKQAQVQILQTAEKQTVVGHKCSATVTRIATFCGFDSITYAHGTIDYERLDFPAEECVSATTRHRVRLDNRSMDVRQSETTYIYVSKGWRNVATGECTPDKFTRNGKEFLKHYEESKVNIQIETLRGVYSIEDDSIQWSNGARTSYSAGAISNHPTFGTMIWNVSKDTCEAGFSSIYIGNATIHRQNTRRRKDSPVSGDIVMVANEFTGQITGLIVKHEQSVCNTSLCHMTHIPQLIICFLDETQTPVTKAIFKPGFDQLDVRVLSAVNHMQLGILLGSYRRFEELHDLLCHVERQNLQTRINSITWSRNEYALLDIFGQGHSLRISGNVAYIIHCMPVIAEVRAHPNCTELLPVTYKNQSMFLDTLSGIIKKHSKTTVCNEITPELFYINGIWYSRKPELSKADFTPRKLNTTTPAFNGSDYKELITGAGGSIYTKDQMKAYEEATEIIDATPEVIGNIVYQFTKSLKKFGVGSIMSMDDVSYVVDKFYYGILPGGEYLVFIYNNIIIIMVLLTSVNVVIAWLVRAWQIFKVKGLGFWMLAAFFSLSTSIVLQNAANIVKDVHFEKNKQMIEEFTKRVLNVEEKQNMQDLPPPMAPVRTTLRPKMKWCRAASLSTLQDTPLHRQDSFARVRPFRMRSLSYNNSFRNHHRSRFEDEGEVTDSDYGSVGQWQRNRYSSYH